jgi:UDP-sulfoquinovose synthase
MADRRVLILGGDGYLGWPTALRFSERGDEVAIVDNLLRRRYHLEQGTDSLTPIRTIRDRVAAWQGLTGRELQLHLVDLTDYAALERVIREFEPTVVIHYGEQPSAPFSMIDRAHAVDTQVNNVVGTLNLLFAIRDSAPDCHLIKLGTMGEYGTPNIDIEEGFIEITHNGRSDRLPYPKQPGSFYHLSKVHDSHNIIFACRAWGIRATDLNQGIVYGIDTEETGRSPELITRFDYDECFGTVLNRFCVQAVIGHPLTVYGRGGQTRSFLNINDTLQCVELAAGSPPALGEYVVFNQFTELFSVRDLAELVAHSAAEVGFPVEIEPIEDPRVELEEHYYNAKQRHLLELGLQPRLLSEELVESMLHTIERYRERVVHDRIVPRVRWRPTPHEAVTG